MQCPAAAARLACAHELAVTLVFRLDEVRQDVFVRPAVRTVRRPLVVVVTIAAHVQHVVYVARTAQTLPRVPDTHLLAEHRTTLFVSVAHWHSAR